MYHLLMLLKLTTVMVPWFEQKQGHQGALVEVALVRLAARDRFTSLECCNGGLLRCPTISLMLCVTFSAILLMAFSFYDCSSERSRALR